MSKAAELRYDGPASQKARGKIVGRGLRSSARLPLAGLRQAVGKTQSEVAHAAHMDQSEISRLERREDILLSTLRRYVAALEPALRQPYRAGDKLFVDWAGRTVEILSTNGGAPRQAYLFVAVLGANDYIYAELFEHMRTSAGFAVKDRATPACG